MLDLYYWPTPNGHKITLFLEETASGDVGTSGVQGLTRDQLTRLASMTSRPEA